MVLRLACMDDLPKLNVMYGKIIDYMNQNNIQIWDEIYPCEWFASDIENSQLYLLVETYGDFAAAFALCGSNAGESAVSWKKPQAKALYLDRLGVSTNYMGRGVGSAALRQAAVLAKQKDAEYLRLFIVDCNQPAIELYLKNGFLQAGGVYEEKIDDLVLREYGFEIEV